VGITALARRIVTLDATGGCTRLRGALSLGVRHGATFRRAPGVALLGAHIQLGDRVTLEQGVYVNANGPNGMVRIGDDTHVDCNGVLYGQGGLTIGRGCAIAAGVIIYSQTNQYDSALGTPVLEQKVRYAPVTIQDGVWIGAGAIILPGVCIGSHAVVAAGAVVREDVEARTVVAGVPAKLIKRIPCI